MEEINYCFNHEEPLKEFFDYGELALDNSVAESTLSGLYPVCDEASTYDLPCMFFPYFIQEINNQLFTK